MRNTPEEALIPGALEKYSHDLTALARQGRFTPLQRREKEAARLVSAALSIAPFLTRLPFACAIFILFIWLRFARVPILHLAHLPFIHLLFPRQERQQDGKGRALTFAGGYRDLAAMRRHNLSGEVEAQSQPTCSLAITARRLIKTREDMGQISLRDAWAIILHLDLRLMIHTLQVHLNAVAVWGVLDRIHQQIHHNLSQAPGIALHRQRIATTIKDDLLLCRQRLRNLDRIGYQFIQADGFKLEAIFTALQACDIHQIVHQPR